MAEVQFSPGKIKIEIWCTPEEVRTALIDFSPELANSPFDISRKLYNALKHVAKMGVLFNEENEVSDIQSSQLPHRIPVKNVDYSEPTRDDLSASALLRDPFPGPQRQSERPRD